MKKTSPLLAAFAACAAACLALAPARAHAGLIGSTFFDGQLININSATGEGSLAAALPAGVAPYGLAFKGSRLYTFNAGTDRVHQIDRVTGAVSAGTDIGVGDLIGEGDLAFRNDGIGFLSSGLTPDFSIANDLFRFDLNLGTSVRIGTTAVTLDGLAFVGNTLYGLGQFDDQLYVVDQSTAALTSVGSLGLMPGSSVSGLAADSRGSLYAAIDDRLYTIDSGSGLATAVDMDVQGIGYGAVSGLAFTPVPEPSLYGLAGASVLGGIAFMRRRRLRAAR